MLFIAVFVMKNIDKNINIKMYDKYVIRLKAQFKSFHIHINIKRSKNT